MVWCAGQCADEQAGGTTDVATLLAVTGFTIMMVLDMVGG